jgi:hypothetical protein
MNGWWIRGNCVVVGRKARLGGASHRHQDMGATYVGDAGQLALARS